MCSDLGALSQGCAFYSATGILFMSWVGIMLMKQPFFIGGIDDVELAMGSAFGAAGSFFFTFLVSIMYMIHDARQIADGRDQLPTSRTAAAAANRNGGARGDYGQVPVFRDFDDPVNTNVPQNFETEGIFT